MDLRQTTILTALACLLVAASALPVFCQVPLLEKTTTTGASADTDTATQVIRDASHPTWRAIQAQYAKLAKALKKKDLDALFALYTPDYRVVLSNGSVITREQSLAYQRGGYALVKETHHISNTILWLAMHGESKATATVLQQWYRTQMMVGKLRRVETNGVQQEEWIKTLDGWKRGNLYEIQGGTFVDGKRVDTSKPYDPEAPAYDPGDPHPLQPVADALFAIIADRGIDAALREFPSLRRQSDVYYLSEASINALGYRLLGTKKTKEAVAIFKLNAEAYPNSANVYDSLAEAYLTDGNKEQAIRNYRKSLELNPQNQNARDHLKKMEESADDKPRDEKAPVIGR